MRLPMKQLILAAILLTIAVGLRIADPGAVARLRLSVFDTYQRLSPRVPDGQLPVRVVDIDDASLARLGQWPWPRTRLADLIDTLHAAGAASIALDIVLAEPDRFSARELSDQLRDVPAVREILEHASKLPDNDSRLASSISAANVVVAVSGEPAPTGRAMPAPKARFAVAGDDPKLFVPGFPGGTPSLDTLTTAAQGIGAVNWLPENDQIVRRVPTFITVAGTLYPSLAIEQLRLSQKTGSIFIRSSAASGIEAFGQHSGLDSLRIGETILHTDGDGQMWLHFAPFNRARYTSASSVLDGSADKSLIAGRHIIIGSSATGLLDLRATPLDPSIPGVEIHAQALEQFLTGGGIVRPAWATGAELLLIVLGGALIAWQFYRSLPVVAAAAGAAALAAVTAGSWFAFRNNGVLLDPVYPGLTLVVLYLASSLFNYIQAETERSRVRTAFSHYLSPSLVEQLAADPSKLKLGGETRDITLLIADVRGFSRLSEGMDASEVLAFVNGVFTPMTDIILNERGTIDKFMGDAVMAFWNAPLADSDHATNGLRAALRMMDRLGELNTQRSAEAAANGIKHEPIRMGIGINTGPCSVGNVGSPQRLNYSILGDPVNTASRLEESTKIYGAPIMCGAATAAHARDFALLEIGAQTLRGKDRSERMFAVIGDEAAAQRAAFKSMKQHHGVLVTSLAAGDVAAAKSALELCRGLRWPGLDPLWDKYAERIAAAKRKA